MEAEAKYSNLLYGGLLGLLGIQYCRSSNPKWLVYLLASVCVITVVGVAFRTGVSRAEASTPRPLFRNKTPSVLPASRTNGMPSLHVAASSLVVVALALGGAPPLAVFLAVGLLLGVVYFRVAGEFHDGPQVGGGVVFGAILGVGMVGLGYTASWVVLLVLVLASLGGLVADFFFTFRDLYQEEEKDTPGWFDPALTSLLEKNKKASTLGLSVRNFTVRAGWPFRQIISKGRAEPIRASWKSIEDHLRSHLPKQLTPDVVVGIKSGGAFLTKFIAEWYGIPFAYMKVSRYSGRSLLIQAKNFHGKDDGVSIPEPVSGKMVRGKNVLLVDDTLATGMSLKIAKNHLLDSGARSVTTLVYSVDPQNVHLCDYFIVDASYVAWPWGFDA